MVLQQAIYFMLQKINLTMQLFLPPVVIVTAKHVNNDSSVSECNAITAWVKVINQFKLALI